LVTFHLKNILLQTIEVTGGEMWTESNFYSLLSEGAQVPEVDSVFSPKTIPFPSRTTWKIIVEMHPVGQLVLHLLCPGARDAGRSQEHRCAQLRCDEGR